MCFLVIFAFMRLLMFFILLLAFGCQQTTVNGQQTPCTVPEPVEGTTLGASTSSATAYPRTVDCCPLYVDYYEKQIHIADSLYKNYLPQYNFDEVKAAMEFFDSYQPSAISGQRWRLFDKEADDGNRLIAESRQLTAAKAHYYHAVGLTEKDDIVGACEHYLIALEIMEDMMAKDKSLKTKGKKSVDCCPLSVDNPEDYEKTRFVSLVYTRLGQIFYNENYCDIATLQYKRALEYIEKIGDNASMSLVLKFLGNSYQLNNMLDSALYYYTESLKKNKDFNNKLDIEKNIAQILFYKGERDTAFSLVKNNLTIIDNENVKYSYYTTLGKMYYEDKIYDSAIYYYETSIRSNNINIKLSSAISLSSIYDSINDKEKKAAYDNILSKLFVEESKDIVNKTKLQSIYESYKERKLEKERIKNRRKIFLIVISMLFIVIIMFTIILGKYKKKHLKLSRILNEKESNINDKDDIINQITKEIKLKEEELQKLLFKNSFTDGKLKSKNAEIQNKDELIKKYELEIISLNNKLERTKSGLSNVNEYYHSLVCSKILKQIEELSEKNMDTSCLEPLKQEELFLLLKHANRYLNNLFIDLSSRFTKLKKDDLYYLSLIIIDLNDKQISSLFGVTYNSIKVRKKKICSIFNITTEELYSFLNKYL